MVVKICLKMLYTCQLKPNVNLVLQFFRSRLTYVKVVANQSDIKDKVLLVQQGKSNAKLRISITGELKSLLERTEEQAGAQSAYIAIDMHRNRQIDCDVRTLCACLLFSAYQLRCTHFVRLLALQCALRAISILQ